MEEHIIYNLFSPLGVIGGTLCGLAITFSTYGTSEGVGFSFNKFTGSLFLVGIILIIYAVLFN